MSVNFQNEWKFWPGSKMALLDLVRFSFVRSPGYSYKYCVHLGLLGFRVTVEFVKQ